MKSILSLEAVVLLSVGVVCGSATAQGKSLMASGGNNNPGSPTSSKEGPAAPVRDFSTEVRNGILTVDGMVGKAQMNYHVKQGFLYFTVPGVGTAIVAQTRFMNAAPQKNAFHGNTLTIDVNGHTVELSNDDQLVAGKSAEAWVAIDPLYGANIRFPEMGYGDTTARPYIWPGAETVKADKASAVATAPPLPAALRPKPEIASSYTVIVPGTDAPPKK